MTLGFKVKRTLPCSDTQSRCHCASSSCQRLTRRSRSTPLFRLIYAEHSSESHAFGHAIILLCYFSPRYSCPTGRLAAVSRWPNRSLALLRELRFLRPAGTLRRRGCVPLLFARCGLALTGVSVSRPYNLRPQVDAPAATLSADASTQSTFGHSRPVLSGATDSRSAGSEVEHTTIYPA